MKIRKHYLTLRRSFPHVQEDTPLDITLEELASHLECTHRNMVLVLKRMQQELWITWLPKKGRSNRSTLLFHAKKEAMLMEEAKELVARQDLHAALELLQASEEAPSLREQFQEWLSGQFGFRSEVQNQRRTDVLRFPLTQTIHTLDPAAIHYAGESHLVNQLFDSLVRMDVKGDHILPHLAHAWEVDASRTHWTFYLRKGVQFHHGRDMQASDVKYSLERLQRLAPRGLYSWAYANIREIATPDETTVRIQLTERNDLFLGFLTTNRASIVPADVYEKTSDVMIPPTGTGPFRLTGQDQGIWILEAFPVYFQGRGFLDRVEVWTLPEKEHTDLEDKKQPFQVMHNVRISDMAAERWQQVRQSGMTTKFVTVNELKEGPLRNPHLREVLDLALNRAYLLEQLSGDVIETADSFFPHTRTDADTFCQENVPSSEQIKELLAEAGYQGELLTLATIPQYEHDALLLQKMYVQAGIHLRILLIPAEDFKGEQRMAADLVLFAIMLDEHRELRLYDMYKSMRQHAAHDVQMLLDDNLLQIQLAADSAHRKKLLEQLETKLKQRHSLLFLYRKHLKTAYHPSIRGISLDSLGWVRFRDIWFT